MIIGVGCDIVQIERIRKAMRKESFLRILTEQERDLYESLSPNRQPEWLAGRFAAKEAVYKAIHTLHPCVLSKIEILSTSEGAPYCALTDCDIHLSISHEKDYAIAYAIAEKKE